MYEQGEPIHKDVCMLRRFHFDRIEDASGVSGCGKVAEGCLFTDTGEAVVHWLGEHGSINVYHCLNDIIFVHGHEGRTIIVFDDPQPITNQKEKIDILLIGK